MKNLEINLYPLQTKENIYNQKYKDEKPHSTTKHEELPSIPAGAPRWALMAGTITFISVV